MSQAAVSTLAPSDEPVFALVRRLHEAMPPTESALLVRDPDASRETYWVCDVHRETAASIRRKRFLRRTLVRLLGATLIAGVVWSAAVISRTPKARHAMQGWATFGVAERAGKTFTRIHDTVQAEVCPSETDGLKRSSP